MAEKQLRSRTYAVHMVIKFVVPFFVKSVTLRNNVCDPHTNYNQGAIVEQWRREGDRGRHISLGAIRMGAT